MNGERQTLQRSLRQRILDRLFPPAPHISLEHLESLPWMRNLVFQDVTAYLSWPDRLRVLVSGKIAYKSVTAVSTEVERTDTEIAVWVAPPGRRS